MYRFLQALLLVSLLTTSCSPDGEKTSRREAEREQAFRRDKARIYAEVNGMIDADQGIRTLANFGTNDSATIDSIRNAFTARKLNLDNMLMKNDTLLVSARFRDSVWNLITGQDEQNNRRMLALMDQYGYPASDRVDSTTHVSPFILLHHPTAALKDTMMRVLDRELALGRIDTTSYEMVKWDYNGRQGIPNIKAMKATRTADGMLRLEF